MSKRERTVKDTNIIEQKCWQYIQEVNSTKQGIDDLAALEDCKRTYSYRQMYGMWEQYARVFSALGITGNTHARAAVEGTPCAETSFAFFGLNMTGASVSMTQLSSRKRLEKLSEQIKRDHITDLILTDYDIDARFLKRIMKEKGGMGLSNVIVLHVPVEGDLVSLWDVLSAGMNHRELRDVPGALFMEDLLEKYADHPVSYAEEACSDSAVVIHTSGTTEGVPKPVPLSDRAVNETLRRHTLCGKTAPAEGRMTSMIFNNLFSGAAFIGMMTPLANGGKLVALPMISPGLSFFSAVKHYRLTNIVFFSALLDLLTMIPFRPDLSSVQTVLLVGSFSSADSIKQCRKFFRQCGSHAKVLVGYGLSEAGVGITLSDPKSRDESVGYLLPGVKAKLWDEDEERFHDMDGREHTGVLYISTPSLSSGVLDDEVIFELDEIEGEKYLNTHDLFNVREDGAFYYLGRMNRFFVNEEGVRFDAGLIERAVSARKGIKNCGLAPVLDKKIHDTVPVLYVETTRKGRGGYRIVRDALAQAYIADGLIEKTELPVRCVITDSIPRTETGKVDVHQITDGNVRGDTYKVKGIYEDGVLSRIELEPVYDTGFGAACDWLAPDESVDEEICGMGCDMLPCSGKDDSQVGKAPVKLTEEIEKRLQSGEITEQKSWKFIKELNSYSDERLDATALSDSSRDYTYRQMFELWDKYAGVFSALGISGENRSRAGMVGTCAVEPISALYALNMTGASVSMIAFNDFNDIDNWKKTVTVEGITDVILNDIDSGPDFIRELVKEKEKLGIRNIIVQNIAVAAGDDFSAADVRAHRRKQKEIRKIEGILFMDDLVKKYGSHPVNFGSDESSDAAVIIHTSGTVSGIHKPVPHSDAGFNEAAARIVRDDRFRSMMGRAVTCSGMDMSGAYALMDQIHLMLAFGGRLYVLPGIKPGMEMLNSLIRNKANIAFFAGLIFDVLLRLPFRIDLSSFEFIIVGGSYISAEAKKRYDRFLARNGAKTKMMIGYGLSEAGAACILAPKGRKDEAIGYPLSGVKVKLLDENDGKYYDPEEGPHTGVLHIASKSVSSGRIDDKVFFELEEIDGEKYLNTYDLVRSGEDGALYYEGRMNKYFVNNEGVRFDAGLVETAVAAEPGIEACGLAPEYEKILHDTIPVLYVQTATDKRDSLKAVREALVNVFVRDGSIEKTNLPSVCVITDDIPLNEMGKVDIYRISKERVDGRRLSVMPVKREGVLKSVDLVPQPDDAGGPSVLIGVPDELEETVNKMTAAFKE